MNRTLNSLVVGMESQLEEVARRFDAEIQSDLACVASLARHVARFRGKMLRPMIVLLAGRAGGRVDDVHLTIATVVEMVHMATLVHDDVLDEAELRRRGATINHLKGNEAAVLLGDFLISHSYHLCSQLDDQFAARTIASTTNRVCEGELLQLDNRGNLDLSQETYMTIIERKTAALISASAMLGAYFAGASPNAIEALRGYGEAAGIAFQIQDDVLDLIGDNNEVGKPLGSDIEQTKLTLPLIHFLKTAPDEHRRLLRSLLKGDEPDRAEKVRNLIAPSGSVAYAQAVAENYVERAIRAIRVLEKSEAKSALEEAARFITRRTI